MVEQTFVYDIEFSDTSKDGFLILPGTTDTTTSLSLSGNGNLLWGEDFNESLVHIMENFSSDTAPVNPIEGQFWYKTTNDEFYAWGADGSPTLGWFPLGIGPGVPVIPYVKIAGDTMTGQLNINSALKVEADGSQALDRTEYWAGSSTGNFGQVIDTSGSPIDNDMGGLFIKSGDNNNDELAIGVVGKETGGSYRKVFDMIGSSGDTSWYDGATVTLAQDPTLALHAATKQYVDAADDLFVLKTGDTMTGPLIINADLNAIQINGTSPRINFNQGTSNNGAGLSFFDTNSQSLLRATCGRDSNGDFRILKYGASFTPIEWFILGDDEIRTNLGIKVESSVNPSPNQFLGLRVEHDTAPYIVLKTSDDPVPAFQSTEPPVIMMYNPDNDPAHFVSATNKYPWVRMTCRDGTIFGIEAGADSNDVDGGETPHDGVPYADVFHITQSGQFVFFGTAGIPGSVAPSGLGKGEVRAPQTNVGAADSLTTRVWVEANTPQIWAGLVAGKKAGDITIHLGNIWISNGSTWKQCSF